MAQPVKPGALKLRNCGITKNDLEEIGDFSERKRIRFHELDLSHNHMLNGGGADLGKIILKMPHHNVGSSLNLSHCNLTSFDLQAMAKVIETKELGKLHLRKLDLSHNMLTNGGQPLAAILRKMPAWAEVNLSNCLLSAEDVECISGVLSECAMEGLHLDLSENKLAGSGSLVCSLMKTNKYFKKW